MIVVAPSPRYRARMLLTALRNVETRAAGEFDESKHQRDTRGQFTDGGDASHPLNQADGETREQYAERVAAHAQAAAVGQGLSEDLASSVGDSVNDWLLNATETVSGRRAEKIVADSIKRHKRIKALGDAPGHEFHGNQWTAGEGEGGGITKRPDGAPIVQHPVAGSIAEGRGIKIGSRVSYSYRAPGEDMGKRGSGKVVGFVSNNGRDKGSVQDVVIRDRDEIKFVAEKNVRTSIRAAGDVEGHEFHGNQWTEGQGHDENGLNKGTGQRAETGGGWNVSPAGEEPYGWHVKQDYGSDWKGTDPEHVVVRDGGLWGSSHGASSDITGSAAKQMSIEGYHDEGNDRTVEVADRFLNAIAEDKVGAPEVLHHSFENVRGTKFEPGDTVRMPLTATSGKVGNYGIRLDADSQRGQPVVFEFEKGTQMAAYSKWKPADAKDFGHIYSEALVAGGFKVKSVREVYMGSQHFNAFYQKPENKDKVIQIYGKVVRLEQTESFHPKEGWSKHG